jgi:hypothetical protein
MMITWFQQGTVCIEKPVAQLFYSKPPAQPNDVPVYSLTVNRRRAIQQPARLYDGVGCFGITCNMLLTDTVFMTPTLQGASRWTIEAFVQELPRPVPEGCVHLARRPAVPQPSNPGLNPTSHRSATFLKRHFMVLSEVSYFSTAGTSGGVTAFNHCTTEGLMVTTTALSDLLFSIAFGTQALMESGVQALRQMLF